MKNIKWKYYVAVLMEHNIIKYITNIEGNEASWNDNQEALPMSENKAMEIVFQLAIKKFPAIIIKMPYAYKHIGNY